MKHLGILAVIVLVCVNAAIAYVLSVHPQSGTLKVSFLNIGQGDSILIQGPTGVQVLVDGGPDRSVLRELAREIPPLDRSLDMLVETHPDKDHISGLSDVLAQYDVSYFLEPGIPDDTQTAARVEAAASDEPGITRLLARRGMRIHLGGTAYADVLYPTVEDLTEIRDTNSGSVVLHIVYGDTSFLLTGDLPSSGEDHLVTIDSSDLRSDVLKAGHHGSKYSSDAKWLTAVAPKTVVISAGKGNTYGHPNPEALARIQKEGAAILTTIDHGTIDFTSDGKTITEKSER